MSEKFSLKWNDFQTNVSKSFKDLRKQNHFYDVTLVSSDPKQISAHKVVLSACSEYFQNILKQNSNSHPWLCLDGVTSTDINNMLDYVYLGEVQIHQDDLDRFLQVAKRFQLEGLLQQNEEEENVSYEYEKEHEKIIIPKEQFRRAPATDDTATLRQKISEVPKITIPGVDLKNHTEIQQKVEELFTQEDKQLFLCNICGKSFKKNSHIRDHVEIHIEGLSYNCNICGKESRSSIMLSAFKHN